MKSSEITIGGTYTARVSDRFVTVRIERANSHGGWDATNLATQKHVRIKSAQRLRGRSTWRDNKNANPPVEAPKPDTTPAADPDRVPLSQLMKKPPKGAKAPKADKPAPEPKPAKALGPPRPSGLTAAHQVLIDAGDPMRCKDMVEKMLATGAWKTDGKTPEATIYAAIIREIRAKGGEARFKKTDRGLFTINA